MSPSRSAARHLHLPRKPWGSEPASSRSRLASVAKVLAILCAEYRRAVAAERRYEELRHTNASSLTGGRTNRADIARRLFTEIYL